MIICFSDIQILNGLAWTAGLDEIWKENREKYPTLLWQYFGSQTGIMRNYPGLYSLQLHVALTKKYEILT